MLTFLSRWPGGLQECGAWGTVQGAGYSSEFREGQEPRSSVPVSPSMWGATGPISVSRSPNGGSPDRGPFGHCPRNQGVAPHPGPREQTPGACCSPRPTGTAEGHLLRWLWGQVLPPGALFLQTTVRSLSCCLLSFSNRRALGSCPARGALRKDADSCPEQLSEGP